MCDEKESTWEADEIDHFETLNMSSDKDTLNVLVFGDSLLRNIGLIYRHGLRSKL